VASGVYRYRTTGQETVDVLGGATHHYPTETTITVTRDGCGVRLHWDALVERRDEWALCATPTGTELQTVGLRYHEFFGSADAEDVICDRTVVLVPATPATPSSAPVRPSCTLANDPWRPTWQVLEATQRSVAGEIIDVPHVRMVIEDNDEDWEHTTFDWYLGPDGLPVETAVDKESRSPSPIGAVIYREIYRLQLVSPVPLT